MTNCAAWVIARILDVPVRAAEILLRPYADRGWLQFAADHSIDAVLMPEAACDLLKSVGLGVSLYRGPERTVAEWAARSASQQYRDAQLILVVDGTAADPDPHALLAQDGLVFDNRTTRGKPGAAHPYGPRRVCDLVQVRAHDA